jgi:hypothetical protein
MTFDVSRLERTEQIIIRQVISETTDQHIFIVGIFFGDIAT